MHTIQTNTNEYSEDDQTAVYLAGPIKQTSDGGTGWRQRVQTEYRDHDVTFVDPTDNINVPGDELDVVAEEPATESEVTVEEIVAEDKKMLRESDIVLVGYSDVKSVGTPMEVQWAYGRNYYIFMWIRDDTPRDDLSVWYRYHCDYISDELDDVMNQLQKVTQ